MAYRQLFAVTFAALGLCLAACSGGPGPSQDSGDAVGTEQPPASPETAPGNPDQPPGNPDQPPGNPDQPPGSSGGAEVPVPGQRTACERLCDQVAGGCPGNHPVNQRVRGLCDDDCESVDGVPACAALVATAIACVSGLNGLCTEEGPANADACAASVAAAEDCTDGGGGGGGDDDELCEACRRAGGGAACDVVCE